MLFLCRAAIGAGDGAHSMNLYHNLGGWTLVFAALVSAVICDALGTWMG